MTRALSLSATLLASLGFWAMIGGAPGCGTDDGGPTVRLDGGTVPDGGMGCTIEPRFNVLYAQLFNNLSCNIPGCHGAPASGDLTLSGPGVTSTAAHDALLSNTFNIVGVTTFSKRVVPGDPDHSYLWNKISTDTPAGGTRMPQGGMLSDCQQQAIRTWIMNGAKND